MPDVNDVKKIVQDAAAKAAESKPSDGASPPVLTDNSAAMQAEIDALKAKLAALQSTPLVVAASEPSGPGCFLVQLNDCAPLIMEASDRYAAIEAYYKACGVLSTIHKPSVSSAAKPSDPPHKDGFWTGDGKTPDTAEKLFPKVAPIAK